jgi:hypothetical protein
MLSKKEMCPHNTRLPLPPTQDARSEHVSPFHLCLHDLEVYYSHLAY